MRESSNYKSGNERGKHHYGPYRNNRVLGKQSYANKSDALLEIDTFLERYKLTQ